MENETQITWPKYLPCSTQAAFDKANKKVAAFYNEANKLNIESYAMPIIDKYGKYFLTINIDVKESLTESELSKCVEFSEIELPEVKI